MAHWDSNLTVIMGFLSLVFALTYGMLWKQGSITIFKNKNNIISSHMLLWPSGPFIKMSTNVRVSNISCTTSQKPCSTGLNWTLPAIFITTNTQQTTRFEVMKRHRVLKSLCFPSGVSGKQSLIRRQPGCHRLSSFPGGPFSVSLSSMGRVERTLLFSLKRPERDTFMFLRQVCSLKTDSRLESS